MVSVEEAREETRENFKGYKSGIEEVGLLESNNRILAEDIHSNIDVQFNRSTVDDMQ